MSFEWNVQIKEDGITRLVVLPLYPQFSISTSGSSLRLLESLFRYLKYFQKLTLCVSVDRYCCVYLRQTHVLSTITEL